MSIALQLDMPEGAFSALHKDPKEFTMELRLAAAVKWYEMAIISQEKAAGNSRSVALRIHIFSFPVQGVAISIHCGRDSRRTARCGLIVLSSTLPL